MKKLLLTICATLLAFTHSSAVTIDDICGVYEEHTTGTQALSFLCGEYYETDITNVVIISKNANGKVEIKGFYKDVNVIKGTFDEANQTISFGAQAWGGTGSGYSLNKSGKVTATVNADGTITFDGWTVTVLGGLFSKDMKTTFTPLQKEYSAKGSLSAPGYLTGTASVEKYGNWYMLTEGENGYTHAVTTNTDGNLVLPWALVLSTDDDYCIIYNTKEDEDQLMLSNGKTGSFIKTVGSTLTISSPFQYYEDKSDALVDNPKPTAEGTYVATFDLSTTGIAAVSCAFATSSYTYNLMGQRISASQKGIVIRDGKKYMVR